MSEEDNDFHDDFPLIVSSLPEVEKWEVEIKS